MKVDVKEISEVEKEVKIEIPADDIAKEREKTIGDLQKKVSVKGFRKGKTPASVLEKMYADRIDYELTERVIQEKISAVLEEHRFVPVVRPALNNVEYAKGQPFSFGFKVDIKPTLDFSSDLYSRLKLSRPDPAATDEEVAAELARLQDRQAALVPVDEGTALAKGLVAIIDFEGTIDGKPFSGGSATNFSVEVAQGKMLPEFDNALPGMTVGEKKTISLHFPEEYPAAELKGKDAQFVITLQDIKRKSLPALDDEFAKDLEAESLAALKERIAAGITEQKEKMSRPILYQRVIDILQEKIQCPIPTALLEREKQMTGRSEEEAAKRLKADFILEAVARQQNCTLNEDDLQRKVQELAAANRISIVEVVEYYRKNDLFPYLQFQILAEKALENIIGQAEITVEASK